MSVTESRTEQAMQLSKLQDLYDRHLYLDAYNLTSQYWTTSTNVKQFSTDELIVAGRLSERLGGSRLSRKLLREVLKRDPSNPRVRYFTRHARSSRLRVLDELKAFISQPDLGGDDPILRAGWYASYGVTWATLRDFDHAYECLALAHSLSPNDTWVLTCESDALGIADRWADSLTSAERAWEINPGSPLVADSLGTSLINLGQVAQSADRLYSAAENSQSFELVADACWHQCALAETLEGPERSCILERARTLAHRLPLLTPLADRDSRAALARCSLDIAELADDYPEIERWSMHLRSPFHRQLLQNLKSNPEGKRIRLPLRRTIQTHEACVPASIAAAMSANGMDISAEEMAAEITFGGTTDWAAADWLRARGFHVRFFCATPPLATELIQHEVAFVIGLEGEESGHAVAVVGLDQRAGTLLVHDPQGFRGAEYLLTILDSNTSPLGVKGMAVVTEERSALLDTLLPPESTLVEGAQEHQKAMAVNGPVAARKIVTDLTKRFPLHPGVLYLQSIQNLEDGNVGQALQGFHRLLLEFPNSPHVRVRFMSACRALGNTALVRETLRNIVERGILPGLESQQNWIHPPDRYVFEYADLLRLSAETRDQAELLLHSLIRRQSTSAGAWHNLGDLLWQKCDIEGALLCYRLASCLATSDEHYARAYADGLADEKREEEAFRWLEGRARRFGSSSHAVATWISWISALEDRGYPQRALAGCNDVLGQHGDSTELLSFAVPFFARMGDWKRAESELSRLKSKDNAAAFYEASVHFFRMRGRLKEATMNAEAWLQELPRSMDARRTMLDLIAKRDGTEASVQLARRWMRENKCNEEFEDAYCTQLDDSSGPKWRKYGVLLRRLKRNPEDAWAWRDVTLDCLYEYDLADSRGRQRIEPRIKRLLAECDRTSGESVATIRAHALWSEYRSDWAGAVAKSIEAIKLDPQNFYSYRRIWECSARLADVERKALWTKIEATLINSSGHLSIARDVMGLLAERFGPVQAEKAIETWRDARSGDPDVIEAAADLLIDKGHGRSDSSRAIAVVKPAVERYPYHSGLQFSLANAYRRAGQDSEAETVLSEIVRRHPDNSSALIQLAWIRHRDGDEEGAYRILDETESSNPRSSDVLDARVQILIENQRFDDACEAIEIGLQHIPESVHWRSRAITLLSQCGAHEKSILAARAGVEIYPRGAYLWLLLGRTLNEMRQFAEVGEIDSCLRRSLELNRGLFETADLLSMSLADQRRYDDAAGVMHDIEKRMSDPSPALGRLAWIRRERGQKRDALDDLSKAVIASPWYSWGWSVLIDWLEEDQELDQTRRLLRDIPPQMFTNTSFRLRRLLLLEKAGLDRGQLDTEWSNLLKDFPEDVSLYLNRYDSLQTSGRFDEAAPVLGAILQLNPDNPFILARRTEVLARKHEDNAALDTALRVCFSPLEDSTWPANKVWDIAQASGFVDRLYTIVLERLSAGEKPTLRSFARMIAYVMRAETKRKLQPRTSTWFPPSGAKQIIRLGELVSNMQSDGSSYRAALYRELSDYGYHRLVRRLWKKSRNGQVVNIDEWAQIGRAMVGADLHSEGRKFLRTWRERTGVGMWIVANYTICLSRLRRGQLEEIRVACRDALSGLPHDHCATYLAHAQAEACALLGNKESLMETWNNCSTYFETELEKDEYFHSERRHLLGDIPMLVRYIQQDKGWLYRKALWKLRWKAIWHFGQISAKKSPSIANIPWWVWWIVLMLALQVFRNSQ